MTKGSDVRPLSGVRVVKLAHDIAGPCAAMMVGDLGAEVVKVEPRGGEAGRNSPPFSPGGESVRSAMPGDAEASGSLRHLRIS